MAIEQREHDRTEVVELLDAMAEWEAPGCHVYGLHVGDIGWHLRMDDDLLAGTIHSWWRDGELVATALIEGALARPRIAPASVHDPDVCRAVAEVVDAIPHDEVFSEAQAGSMLRTLLVGRGWNLSSLWTALHLDLRHVAPHPTG
jgi:hypothetical protein